MKKKFLLGLLTIVMCLTLVACGKTKNESEKENNKESNVAFESYEEVTKENYHEVIKNVFGFDPVEDTNWELTKVIDSYFYGEDGDAYIYYDYKFEYDDNYLDTIKTDWAKKYFDAINAISTDGVYDILGYTDDYDYIKSDKLTDYSKSKNTGNFGDNGWLYYLDDSELQLYVDISYSGCQVKIWRNHKETD